MTKIDIVSAKREFGHLGIEIQSSKSKLLLVMAAVLLAGLWPNMATAQESRSDIPDSAPLIQLEYPNVPVAPRVLSLAREALHLRIVNNAGVPVVVDVEARSISGDDDLTNIVGRIPLDLHEQRTIVLEPEVMPDYSKGSGFRSQLLVTGRIQDHSGAVLGYSQAPPIFYYRDGRDVMFVYRADPAGGDSQAGGKKTDDSLLHARSESTGGFAGSGGFETPTMGPAPNPAMGKLVKICILLKVNYSDINYGEDFWTNNADKPAY
jgi:hypothetical protein